MLKLERDLPRLTVGSAAGEWNHDSAVRLGRKYDRRLATNADSVCMGVRQFGKPMMALVTQQKLGPVRHALSQMVVAGTMTTQPPVQVRVWSPFGDVVAGSTSATPSSDETPVAAEAAPVEPDFAAPAPAPVAAEEGPKNKVFELSLGSPEDNKIYEVDPNADDHG
jgi:hypothetical protein